MTDVRIGLYFPIRSGGYAGGIEQFLIGLVNGLSKTDGNETYILITHPSNPDWIESYTGPNMEIRPRPWGNVMERAKDELEPVKEYIKPFINPVYQRISGHDGSAPTDDGFIAGLDLDIIHFPTQKYVQTDLPSIYNPHDLQHKHHPEFFSERELKRREIYCIACQQSAAVDVPSRFVKDDVVSQFGIDPEKTYVVPRGPPVESYDSVTDEDIENTRTKFGLADEFMFYPAKAWEHKNHLRLVEAIGLVRDEYDYSVNLVCTGQRTEYWEVVSNRIDELDLGDQVVHLGYVSQTELRSLYRLAQFIVFPSLFEGGGFPLIEAWYEGAPVTCSNSTALAEKADGAARLFDPESEEEIAEAIHEMASDPTLRDSLRHEGQTALQSHDWVTTAEVYRALYRSVAGRSLTSRQEELLQKAREGTVT